MKLTKFMAATAVAFAFGTFAFAESAYDVIKKQSTLKAPETSQAIMLMDNIEKNGTVEHRIMNQYGNRKNGLINTVFEFKTPASVKDTRVLQQEKTAKEDDRWIYVPSMKTVRRIPTGERYKQFVGCEFTYNDMAIRHVDADDHEMLDENATATIKGKTYNCFKIKSVPHKKSEVEYSYRIQYIDKVSYLPMMIEYYDKKDQSKMGKHYTTDGYREIKTAKGAYWFREGATIENVLTGRKTVLTIKDVKFDEGISDAYFTQSWLQTGKAK
ncbi:MAG: outer membrane lipoprotein-sorting protein [Treponema sp.]|nr:outer membrane lipoprotein-sorting protein [Candidatus Treponema equifaecale]